MWEFLDRFINITAPNIRDFRGISAEVLRRPRQLRLRHSATSRSSRRSNSTRSSAPIGFDLIFVTTARTDAEGRALLAELGMPFRDMKKANEAEGRRRSLSRQPRTNF